MAHIPKAIDDLTEAQCVHCRARIIEWAELDPSDRADWLEDTVRDVFLLEHKSHNWEGGRSRKTIFLMSLTEQKRCVLSEDALFSFGHYLAGYSWPDWAWSEVPPRPPRPLLPTSPRLTCTRNGSLTLSNSWCGCYSGTRDRKTCAWP